MPMGLMRKICRIALLFIAFAASNASAQTQDGNDRYPNRPIRLVVGFTAGGPTDIPARFIAKELSLSLGGPVIVENKPGAGGMVAAIDVFHKIDSKGYDLLVCTYNDAVNTVLYKSAKYTLSDAARETPESVVDLLNRKIAEVTRSPEYKDLTEKTGTIPASSTPAELGKIISDSANDNIEIIRRFNLQVD